MSEKLELLIERWEKSLKDGKELCPAELCVDCPELLSDLTAALEEIISCDEIVFSIFTSDTKGPDLSKPLKPEDYNLPNQINGRYHLQSPLGIGHFGTVWLATDTTLARDVAIKIPSPHLLYNQEKLDVFVREAKLLAEVSQGTPHIVEVFDFGMIELPPGNSYREAPLLPFIVMELMEGTLADRDQHLINSPIEVAQIIKDLARALHAAHVCRSGPLVHRDIKPNNIFYKHDAGGTLQVKLGDFGLALSSDAFVSMDYALYGVLDYISPERLNGEFGDVRSDIYSLGVVFYILLTGREPFSVESNSVLRIEKMHKGVFPPPATVNPKLNKYMSLLRICSKAMAADPGARYDNAAQFAEDLQKALQEGIDESNQDSAPKNLKPILFAGGAVVALIACVILLKGTDQKPPVSLATPAEQTTQIVTNVVVKEVFAEPIQSVEMPQEAASSAEMNQMLLAIKNQVDGINEKMSAKEKSVERIPKIASESYVTAPVVAPVAAYPNVPLPEVQEPKHEAKNKPKLPEVGVPRKMKPEEMMGAFAQAYIGGKVPDQSIQFLLGYLEAHSEHSHRAGLLGIKKILNEETPEPNDITLAWPLIVRIYEDDSKEVGELARECLLLINEKYEVTKKQSEDLSQQMAH